MKYIILTIITVAVLFAAITTDKPKTSSTLTSMYGSSPIVTKQDREFNIWAYNK
jgi:hypothetical protein